MDYALFRLINGLAGRWPAVDAVMRFFATDYIVPTSIVCIVVFIWFSARSLLQQHALLALVSVVVSNVIVSISNVIWFRPRPFTTYDDVTLLFYHPSDPSFPANSAATTWALATTIWLGDRRAGRVALALAAMMALSRIFVGIHYPFDVIAGALIGLLSARIVVHRLKPYLEPALDACIAIARRLRLT